MDMLIKLYNLPSPAQVLADLANEGIVVRRAMSYEGSKIVRWVQTTFTTGWADEVTAAFGHCPAGCYIAVDGGILCGFCCLNTTFRNFIGPIGVEERIRRKGVGRGMLLSALNELFLSGYAYAIVGDIGQPAFFKAAAGAIEISDSSPGPYPARIGK
jgi:hypothetical protein